MGGGMDLRGGQSKKSDEAGKGISDLGKSEFPCSISCPSSVAWSVRTLQHDDTDIASRQGKGETVSGTSVDAKNQIANQSTGTADHLDLGMRKET